MKVAIGFDPFGFALRDTVLDYLKKQSFKIVDLGGQEGLDKPYYNIAQEAGSLMAKSEIDRAVLVCGSGMGMAIVANKYQGVFAAPCETKNTAEKARSINNANILTLGAMNTAPFLASEILHVFFKTEFKAGWDQDISSFLDQALKNIVTIDGVDKVP
ncbi:RpiB/LacA/LacB family sugar-phosphate isomerase [Shewanella surugensis]|uniref:RpiB/LacA/LacB family sugar-phosphate isomerase n=1 Tax=Shewanella surugensis TaxID=212020 RepID=A0ABT0LJK5_9GAMM|nr:RpiB/LacA/LacB family sugar-phosphate isomerase [Shewanella surugensis]MCL1127891.1 RpiB/LacA/LacB family sugar-phosphate isomerase [Shewanella surugensis]